MNDFAFAVFCPAITDGSLGDMIYFHSFRNPGLIVDIAQDIRALNNQTVFEKKTGMIIIGGGVVKHHICNANLMRNGAVCQPCISRLSVCVRVCHVFLLVCGLNFHSGAGLVRFHQHGQRIRRVRQRRTAG